MDDGWDGHGHGPFGGGPFGHGPGHGPGPDGWFDGPGPRGGWDGGWADGPGWWFPVVPGLLAALLATLLVLAVLWRTGRLAALTARRPAALPDPGAAAWTAAVDRYRQLAAEYAAFECDPRSVLDLPALVDVRRPATARFVDAFAEATALLTAQRPPAPHDGQFVAAVERAERAWTAAVDAARRQGTADFTADERALLDQLRTLLDVVESSTFEAERRAAFEQARSRFADLERRTGWRLPRLAARAVEDGARGALSPARG
jgi:hypothetical protein